MSWNSFILAILVLAFISGCRKDRVEPTCDCEPLPVISGPSFGWNDVVHSPHVDDPRWNPNDPNEFVVTLRIQASVYHMYKYNLASEELSMLFEGDILFQPDWGSNGWIIFCQRESSGAEEIYKIKANGDSLTQVTFTAGNHWGSWSPSCNRWNYKPFNKGFVFNDVSTGWADTVPFNFSHMGANLWLDESTIVTAGYDQTLKLNLETFATEVIAMHPPSNWGAATGEALTSDKSKVVWPHVEGLFSTNLLTGEVVKHLSSCNSDFYLSNDIHPVSNKMLAVRIKKIPDENWQDNNLLHIYSEIVILNPDGSNEQIISIPFPQ